MTFAYVYIAIALAIGILFCQRNYKWHGVDAEFVFLCAGVAFLWPLSIALDVVGWCRSRR